MKELKNYLHLYLGAKVRYNYYDYDDGTLTIWQTLSSHVLDKITTDWSIKSIQIQLRPLSDIKGDELIQYCKIEFPDMKGSFDMKGIREVAMHAYYEPETFRWLLSKSFDLFGLIEAGLAIDKTKINNHD